LRSGVFSQLSALLRGSLSTFQSNKQSFPPAASERFIGKTVSQSENFDTGEKRIRLQKRQDFYGLIDIRPVEIIWCDK
jgi:hypothetical protein